MIHYQITGLVLPSAVAALEHLVFFLEKMSPTTKDFCLEAHFRSMDSMQQFSNILRSNRFACYGWSNIASMDDLHIEDLSSATNVRLAFSKFLLEVNSNSPLPNYDWDGQPPFSLNAILTETVGKLEKSGKEDYITRTTSKIQAIGRNITRNAVDVFQTNEGVGSTAQCRFHVQIPAKLLGRFLYEMAAGFSLQNGVGSFEFLGSSEDLVNFVGKNKYTTYGFPSNCWSFNNFIGNTPFAIERQSFLCPIPNVTAKNLSAVANQLDALHDEISRCSIIRKYLPWQLENGLVSPRTQDNFILLSRHKSGWLMFVGYEQYADEDPPVKLFKTAITPIVKSMGGELKRVQYIK